MTWDRRNSFTKITTLEELRVARERLDWELDLRERELLGEADNIQGFFSLNNLLGIVSGRNDTLGITAGLVSGGISLIGVILEKMRGRRCKR